jgi:hypothetical protein
VGNNGDISNIHNIQIQKPKLKKEELEIKTPFFTFLLLLFLRGAKVQELSGAAE